MNAFELLLSDIKLGNFHLMNFTSVFLTVCGVHPFGDTSSPAYTSPGPFLVFYGLLQHSALNRLMRGLTSLTWASTRPLRNIIKLSSSLSLGSLIQVLISMPLASCLSKFSLILSIITVFLRSLPNLLRSFTYTPSS